MRRLKIIQRDGCRCCNCNVSGDVQNLEVHHVDYFSGLHPNDYPDDMLKTLCGKCHDKERGREELQKNLANSFKMKGFLFDDLLALSAIIDTSPSFVNTLKNYIKKFKQ